VGFAASIEAVQSESDSNSLLDQVKKHPPAILEPASLEAIIVLASAGI
jgi:hypothetical protein